MAEETIPIPERADLRIGSYRLVQPLGSGGMSSVFRAAHVETGVEVAVKILPRNLARNRTLLQRFLREAKSAEALEHPNIVAIYDHGVDNGQYYLVLEYVSGGDLHDWVRKEGPMSVPDAVDVIRSVAEGLSFAAGQGLIHRDIKPANLLRTPAGTIKIADLGLALQAEAEDERVTREGTTVGTVDYMAPEQARDSRGTSERSDIYSLGCTLYFLLTGQPPFPGGDVTEKLSRHFTASPPDPRDFRPEVPQELTLVIRRMMAKRPENRFANYAELVKALDALPPYDATPPAETRTLDALFDDDDSGPPQPFEPQVGTDPGAGPAVLDAILDDDEDDVLASDGFLPLDLSEEERPAPVGAGGRVAEVSMADLAAIEGDNAPAINRLDRDPRPPSRRLAAVAPTTVPEGGDEGEDEDVDVEEAFDGMMPGQFAHRTERSMTDEERRWLKGLVLGSLGLIVAVIGFHQLYRATLPVSSADAVASEPAEPRVAEPSPAPELEPEPTSFQPVTPPPVAPTSPKPSSPIPAADAPKLASVTTPKVRANDAGAPRPLVSVENPDPATAEQVFAPDVESRFRPDWAAVDVPVDAPGKVHRVRRLADPRDPDQKSTLGAALEVIGNGTVEVADNGPFFEDDLRVSGDNRLVRARPGFRPIICLVSPRLAVVQQQSAFIDLEGRSLTLVGLDLIADAKDLPRNFASIFRCRGGSITLRDCTVTVVNRGGLPLSLIQTVPADKPSRIRLERTLVRGWLSAVVDLAAGATDVYITRSGVVNGLGSAVTLTDSLAAERRVFVKRSAIATRGPAFATGESKPGSRPLPPTFRALGSTFTHLASSAATSLISCSGEATTADELVHWQGESNTIAGWSDWLSVGSRRRVAIADLTAARLAWPGTDARSHETQASISLSIAADHAGAPALHELAPERRDSISQLAVPTALIHEKTVEPFPRPFVPGLTAANGTTGSAPLPMTPPGLRLSTPGQPGVRELAFDAEAPPWSGDLGRFLAASVKPGDSLVRVTVTGFGSHIMSPLRMPDGVSLAIDVVADAKARVPSWSAALPATADSLIDVRGGSLALTGVRLLRGGASALKCLVRVEGGHLVIHRGRLIARGPFEIGGGGLIEFNTSGTRPSKAVTPRDSNWPFDARTDRFTCRISESVLITGGDALSAEAGRGLVALSQCAVAAGNSAFTLRIALVPGTRLDADLWLDHCTVASEHSFVTVGPIRGDEPGPERPWLVSTHRCGFFASFEHRTKETALLLADADAFARGAVFWQASGDAFEVPLFAAAADAPSPANVRPDVSRQWADLWGSAHVHGITGPRQPSGTMNRWLVTRQLKPGEVQAGDLAVDVAAPKDDPPKDLGVDLFRLNITPSPRTIRRR